MVRIILAIAALFWLSSVQAAETQQGIPDAVQHAWEKGAGILEITITKKGRRIVLTCFAGLYNKAHGLVVGGTHCLPDTQRDLAHARFTFRGLALRYIEKNESDQVLFKIVGDVPADMEELTIAEAEPEKGEEVYTRSIQSIPIMDASQYKALAGTTIFYYGSVTYRGNITDCGMVKIGTFLSKKNATSFHIKETPHKMCRLIPLVGEPGSSGGPVFNKAAKVIGTIISGGTTTSVTAPANSPTASAFATWISAAVPNIPDLLKEYKAQ